MDMLRSLRPRRLARACLLAACLCVAPWALGESSMGSSSVSASLRIRVVVPWVSRFPADGGGAIFTNASRSARCALSIPAGSAEPAAVPTLAGVPCSVSRVAPEASGAAAFSGLTLVDP